MEYIVEKVGMSRTLGVPAVPVTLVRVIDTKIVEKCNDSQAVVAFIGQTKAVNKAVEGQQKKYSLSREYNKFATLNIANAEVGDQDLSALAEGLVLKTTFTTKGRGFTGVIKRHGFKGGPGAHGSRFHRTGGSIGNAEFPGRVQKGRKMPGQYGNTTNSVKSTIVSIDTENKIIALKGSISGANGSLGKIKVI
jgi:large subunit ribosomal protein L3